MALLHFDCSKMSKKHQKNATSGAYHLPADTNWDDFQVEVAQKLFLAVHIQHQTQEGDWVCVKSQKDYEQAWQQINDAFDYGDGDHTLDCRVFRRAVEGKAVSGFPIAAPRGTPAPTARGA